MKKTIILIAVIFLFSSFTDGTYKQGTSIIKEGIRVCAEVPHGLVYYEEGHEDEGFGFVSRRILDYRIAIPAIFFQDVYVFGSEDGTGGCLIWVKHEKWAVLDLDSFTLETDFIYDKISEFKEVSVDNERHVGVYEAQAERDGVRETVRIEKYLCSSYYDY